MTHAQAFLLLNVVSLPAWALLLAAPAWRWTQRTAMGTVAGLAIAYLVLFIATFNGLHFAYKSLGAVVYLFQSPAMALTAWVHFLCFDLFAGAWMVRDARRLGILHLATIPCLLVTFLFGPMGLLLYFALRGGLRRRGEATSSSLQG